MQILNEINDKLNASRAGIVMKKALLVLFDVLCVFLSFYSVMFFRYGSTAVSGAENGFFLTALPIAVLYVACFFLFHLYSSLWEHAGIDELIQTILAVFAGSVVGMLINLFFRWGFPVVIFAAGGLVLILMVGSLRLCYRITRHALHFGLAFGRKNGAKRVMIIGAGYSGSNIVKQILDSEMHKRIPVALIDDDIRKRGARIHGVKVMGTTQDIPALAERLKIDEIIFCIPSASAKDRKRILEVCVGTHCELKIIPGIDAMLEGIKLQKVRDVDIAELLGREEVKLDMERISGYLSGSVILVTGGGGSIGSEICRQIARFKPRKLVVFDIYENSAYELYVELCQRYKGELDLEVVIGSVRDTQRVDEIFDRYKPDVVFHAAAHKHVPLMELSPAEAVKNNVFGTLNVAQAADTHRARRFVLISTDKAVNPTNVMGATKYLCELVIQHMNHASAHTKYIAVRFGNVLGSNGSVIPLFRKQISSGGPVTVTHKDMTRFFMTIPEAAKLVIQAGSMEQEGQILVLDMGDQINIDSFARSFIRLSGYEPDVDVQVEYIGLRPGEKMYEELFADQSEIINTSFKGIMVGRPYDIEPAEIKRRLMWLKEMVDADTGNVPEYLSKIVPGYKNDGDIQNICKKGARAG